jgi:hypothetical protein
VFVIFFKIINILRLTVQQDIYFLFKIEVDVFFNDMIQIYTSKKDQLSNSRETKTNIFRKLFSFFNNNNKHI